MRGILINRFGPPEVLNYSALPDPHPTPHQVLIAVAGASVNYADLKARAGSYHLGKTPPFIPGIDISGTVLETGTSVTKCKVGDQVVAFTATGSYAEKAIAHEDLVFIIPESVEPSIAAAFPLAGGAALHMIRTIAHLQEGETVLIHGASGGVGSLAIQIARISGASKIIATSNSSWKEKHIRQCGADEVVQLSSTTLDKQLAELSNHHGFDIILNPIGGNSLLHDLNFLAPFGRLINFGRMSDTAAMFDPETLHETNKSLIGFSFGFFRKHRPQLIQETMAHLIALIADKKLNIEVKHFTLKEASQAHALLEDRKATGKIVLLPHRKNPS